MLDWNRIRVSMKEFCPFAGRNDEISDEQSQLMPLLFGMPYHREAYGEVAPLDKVRQEFTRLQKKK